MSKLKNFQLIPSGREKQILCRLINEVGEKSFSFTNLGEDYRPNIFEKSDISVSLSQSIIDYLNISNIVSVNTVYNKQRSLYRSFKFSKSVVAQAREYLAAEPPGSYAKHIFALKKAFVPLSVIDQYRSSGFASEDVDISEFRIHRLFLSEVGVFRVNRFETCREYDVLRGLGISNDGIEAQSEISQYVKKNENDCDDELCFVGTLDKMTALFDEVNVAGEINSNATPPVKDFEPSIRSYAVGLNESALDTSRFVKDYKHQQFVELCADIGNNHPSLSRG